MLLRSTIGKEQVDHWWHALQTSMAKIGPNTRNILGRPRLRISPLDSRLDPIERPDPLNSKITWFRGVGHSIRETRRR